MYSRVLVPVHGGPQDRRAINLAAAVTRADGTSELTLVYVVEVPQRHSLDSDMPRDVDLGEAVLAEASDQARSQHHHRWNRVTTELLQARAAASAIVDEAIERGVDVIILAATNRLRRGSLSQGATVPYTLDHAPCDVLIIRPFAESTGGLL